MIGYTILYFFITLVVILALYFTINTIMYRRKKEIKMEERQLVEVDRDVISQK